MFVPIVRNILMKRVYHGLFGEKMIALAAAIIATSEQEAEELADGGVPRAKIVLRPNGVIAPRGLPPPGEFRGRQGIPRDALLVLFLGRLSSKKSPDLLLEAFAKIPQTIDGREVWLAFVGPDESGMHRRLKELAKQRGVQARVVYGGAVFGEQKWAVYRDADVFVLPSQNENFGNTALEAAACGTPVVVTENCGVAPLLEGIAGIVVQHETEAVARAVEQVLGDGKLRERLSEGGRTAAGRLGWEEPLSAMEKLYAALAAAHHGDRQSAGQD